MFKRNKEVTETETPTPTVSSVLAEPAPPLDPKYTAPKGRPTPSRKEQNAARIKPLVVADRKAAKAAEREALREQRILEQEAMRTGDEKNLPLKDKGPQRRYVRDYIDARFNVGDYMIIVLFVLVLLGFFTAQYQLITTTIMWLLMAIFGIDLWLMWRGLKKKLTAKFGSDKLEGGLAMYAVNRSMMIRPLRLPKPQVKRGKFPK